MSQEGFLFENVATAMRFYKLCEEMGAKTIEERIEILRLMVKNKEASYLRDAETFVKGKKVLKFNSKGEPIND